MASHVVTVGMICGLFQGMWLLSLQLHQHQQQYQNQQHQQQSQSMRSDVGYSSWMLRYIVSGVLIDTLAAWVGLRVLRY